MKNLELKDILKRPLQTEKSFSQEDASTFVFEVNIAANKHQISDAFKSYYGIEPLDVRTMIVRGKVKLSRRQLGKRSNWKKAYISIPADQELNVFNGGE